MFISALISRVRLWGPLGRPLCWWPSYHHWIAWVRRLLIWKEAIEKKGLRVMQERQRSWSAVWDWTSCRVQVSFHAPSVAHIRSPLQKYFYWEPQIHHNIIIFRFLINVQVQGQHPHQRAPFQIAGLLHAWQISHLISRKVYHESW